MSADVFGHDRDGREDHFEDSAEQKIFQIAKRASVGLAMVALSFSALDVMEIRSRADAANFWQFQIKPQFAALLQSADSEMQRVAYLTLDEPVSVVARVPISRPETVAPAQPVQRALNSPPAIAMPDRMAAVAPPPAYVPPPVSPPAAAPASAPVPLPEPAPVASVTPAPPAIVPKPAPEPVLASLPDSATASIPPFASQSPAPAISAVMPDAPAASSPPEMNPAPGTISLPILTSIPLPRPAPDRAALDEPKEPTPAELLGLDKDQKARAKAEKCLANAVYFESRSEPLRGQMAVAQVVMNRVFSPFYPKDVCSVVYQNAHRRLACQFTFACDGKSKVINERGAWARANRIAKQTLDGKLWVSEVAKSTHYHAAYVHPYWVREMRRMFKTGIHLFYRPYNWGDGSDESGWVKPTKTASKSAKPN